MTEASSAAVADVKDGETDKPVVAAPTPASTTTQDTAPAVAAATESSSAAPQGDQKPASLLDAVKTALSDERKEKPPAPSDGEKDPNGEEAKPGEGEAELPDDPTDEELASYHSKTRRRIKKLLVQRDELRTQIEKEFAPAKQQLDGIVNFVREAGLDKDEVNAGFNIMRLMKQDPEAALNALEPYVHALRQAVGEILPPDLAEKVKLGHVDEATAKETARLRSRSALATQAATAASKRAEEIQSTTSTQALVSSISNAVSQLESQWSSSDPDYASKKQQRVLKEIKLAIHEKGFPKSVEAAVELAKACKKTVDDDLKQFAPNPRTEVRPLTGATSTRATAEPATMQEAVAMALRRA